MNKTNKTNGVAKLPNETEAMRLEVVDLELKARYWKAQFEIRDYTLKAESIQPDYDKYLAEQKLKNEELMAQFQKKMEEMAKEHPELGGDPSETGDSVHSGGFQGGI